jgi:serine/threonine protein kinase/WD40 repeat protein
MSTPVDDAPESARLAKIDRLLRQVFRKEDVADGNQSVSANEEADHGLGWLEPHLIAAIPARFQVMGKLGSGTYGVVFRALDRHLRREVALKILRPEWMTNQHIKRRFLRESRAAARLNHTFIVRVLEADETDQLAWQASDVIEGSPLSDQLKAGPLPLAVSVRIVAELAEALNYAHRQGVVHRDIKPANILINQSLNKDLATAQAFLSDFGLARLANEDLTLSHAGQILGTPQYMAPEQFESGSGAVRPSSDIYSLGVVLFECLTGECPFETAQDLSSRLCLEKNVKARLRELCPGVPKDLEIICLTAMASNFEDRYQSADVLAKDLRCFIQGLAISVRPLRVHEKTWRIMRQNPLVSSLVTILILSLSLLAGGALWISYVVRSQNEQLGQANHKLAQEMERTERLAFESEKLRDLAITERSSFQQLAWNSGIRDAYRSFESDQFGKTRSLLDHLGLSHPAGAQSLEWRLLHSRLESEMSQLAILPEGVLEIRTIPNSCLVAAISGSKVYLIDRATGRIQSEIESGVKKLHALAVHPHKTLLYVAGTANSESDEANLLVFDWQQKKSEGVLDSFPTTIESIAIRSDGKHLICGSRYESPRLIDLESRQITVLTGDRRNNWLAEIGPLQCLAYQKSAEVIGLLHIGETSQSSFLDLEPLLKGGFILSAIGIEGSTMLAVLISNDTICLIDFLNGQVVDQLQGSGNLNNLLGSPDGTLLAASSDSGEVLLWDISQHRLRPEPAPSVDRSSLDVVKVNAVSTDVQPKLCTKRWEFQSVSVSSMTFDGHNIICGSSAGQLFHLRLQQTRSLHEQTQLVTRPNTIIYESVWSEGASQLTIRDRSGLVYTFPQPLLNRFLNDRTGPLLETMASDLNLREKCIASLLTEENLIHANSCNESIGKGLAVCSEGHASVWPIGARDLVYFHNQKQNLSQLSIDLPRSKTNQKLNVLGVSRGGEMVAVQVDQYQLLVIDPKSPNDMLARFDLPGPASCVTWSPDGRFLLAAGNFSSIIQCELENNSMKILTQTQGTTSAIHFLSGKNEVVSTHTDGMVRFSSWESGDSQTLRVHDTSIDAMVVDSRERIGISIGKDNSVAVWSIPDRQRLGTLWKESSVDESRMKVLSSISMTRDENQLWMFFLSPQGPAIRCMSLVSP